MFQWSIKKARDRLRASIIRNFEVGGRPDKWKPSGRSSETHKSSYDNRSRSGKTLVDTGTLRNSIQVKIQGSKLVAGTPVVYAKIHDQGGRINKTASVRSHTRRITQAFGHPISAKNITVSAHTRKMNINIPKREFLKVQPDDYNYFLDTIRKEVYNAF